MIKIIEIFLATVIRTKDKKGNSKDKSYSFLQ